MATPPIEPSNAARGTTRRNQSPANASPVLTSPMAMVIAIPTFQASTASPVASITGPRTPKTMAKSVGVSMPKGIAVTSSRPLRAHQADGEPGVDEVADQDTERGARDHAAEHEVGGKPEHADEQTRQNDELGDVIEGEARESR